MKYYCSTCLEKGKIRELNYGRNEWETLHYPNCPVHKTGAWALGIEGVKAYIGNRIEHRDRLTKQIKALEKAFEKLS